MTTYLPELIYFYLPICHRDSSERSPSFSNERHQIPVH